MSFRHKLPDFPNPYLKMYLSILRTITFLPLVFDGKVNLSLLKTEPPPGLNSSSMNTPPSYSLSPPSHLSLFPGPLLLLLSITDIIVTPIHPGQKPRHCSQQLLFHHHKSCWLLLLNIHPTVPASPFPSPLPISGPPRLPYDPLFPIN